MQMKQTLKTKYIFNVKHLVKLEIPHKSWTSQYNFANQSVRQLWHSIKTKHKLNPASICDNLLHTQFKFKVCAVTIAFIRHQCKVSKQSSLLFVLNNFDFSTPGSSSSHFMVYISTFVPFLSLSKSVKDYSKPFGNCSSVASSSVAEDWADGAPPVAMLKD